MHGPRYLIGVATLLAAAWASWHLLCLLEGSDGSDGLRIAIEFQDARGLRAGADVRCRGVTVGTVRSVGISRDGGKAVAEVEIAADASIHVSIGTSFWIVTPRFRGILSGASGLDTLVRDSYVAFRTPPGPSTPLPPGSTVAGMERPPAEVESENLKRGQHGDLLLSVLVPENHGIRAGAPVQFRGVATGDVRSVALAGDGSHVELQVRVDHRYRRTVTDASEFWIAQPVVSGALFSGFTLSDMGSLVTPYLAYWTPPGQGMPVEDGWRTAAVGSRPDYEASGVPPEALVVQKPKSEAPADPIRLARVAYSAVEQDVLSPDDPIRREGTGLLYLDKSGRPLILTARSLCDGRYTETDVFGSDPEIAQEQIRVVIGGGSVLRAARLWTHAGGKDLAVLVLEDAPPDLDTTPADRILCEAPKDAADVAIRGTAADGSTEDLGTWPGEPRAGRSRLGAILLRKGLAAGLIGISEGHSEQETSIWFCDLPEDLRPAR
ncbi:MAG: hypothetical protein Fur0037_00490 [Planctomycetota bacterium]